MYRDDPLGLTFRFDVQVHGMDLGGWESCKGLKVDFGLKEVREGGNNDHSYWLPDQMKYDKITLTRAMTATDSEKVQTWLASYVDNSRGGTASITLKDARNEPVQTWSLLNVLPFQWQGPSLTAQDNKVAVETLVLVHEGFMAFEAQGSLGGGGKRAKAKLELVGNPDVVEFDYSPQTMKLQRGTRNRNDATSQRNGSTQSIWAGATPRSLSGQGILVENKPGDVRKRAERLLLEWMDPGSGSGAGGGSAPAKGGGRGGGGKQNKPVTPKKLRFSWGDWPPIDCTLKQVAVEYQRFSPTGEPTRAMVSFTVNEEPNPSGHKKTNPTSGGLPGRKAHVLTDGENLHHLAARNYGHPGAWRAVADVNGIDDPFRVRPGQTVYLPNANELIGG